MHSPAYPLYCWLGHCQPLPASLMLRCPPPCSLHLPWTLWRLLTCSAHVRQQPVQSREGNKGCSKGQTMMRDRQQCHS